MREKRQFLRIPLSVPIQFKETGHTVEETNLSRDVSIKGIRFLSHKFVPVSSFIKAELDVTKDEGRLEPIKFIAKVVWVKSIYEDELFEIGAEIYEITKADSSHLASVLNCYVSK